MKNLPRTRPSRSLFLDPLPEERKKLPSRVWFAFVLVFFWQIIFSVSPSYARGDQIEIRGVLKDQLNQVLKAANNFHTANVKGNITSIDVTLRDLLQQIEGARIRSSLAPVQKTHLLRILNSAKEKLERSQVRNEKRRRDQLKGAFREIVQIAQLFRLDRYRIFFCGKDKSVWLQKSWTPKNPIHPKKYGRCGKLVR